MSNATWLADVLRAAGLPIVEEGDWKNRGHGTMGVIQGVLCHHTAGPRTGDHPSLSTVINGRKDLPGPLSHLFLARDGTFHIVAAGHCNHAGKGSWHGITAGNSHFIGIEAENAGTGDDLWPAIQINSYVRGCAAILDYIKADDVMCVGHKEYALPKGRKTDPSFDMVVFREAVNQAMPDPKAPIRVLEVKSTDPHYDMLRKGDMGDSVKELQKALGIQVDGNFGPKTESAVKAFQQANGLKPDGLVGPKTWTALDVK